MSRSIGDLDQQERQLRELYIYRAGIDRVVFEQEQERIHTKRDRLEAQLAEVPDVDGDALDRTLTKCTRVLADLGKSWNRANPQQKRKLQRIVYPEGVPVLNRVVGTALTADVIRVFRPSRGTKGDLVAPMARMLNTTRSMWRGWRGSGKEAAALNSSPCRRNGSDPTVALGPLRLPDQERRHHRRHQSTHPYRDWNVGRAEEGDHLHNDAK